MLQVSMKQARVGANLTQQEIADKMGIHVQTYQRMESHPGDVTIKQGKIFAEIVGLKFDDIFLILTLIKLELSVINYVYNRKIPS